MIEGSCLCGSLRWTFDKMPERVTACSCTDPLLGFHFCPTCGCAGFRKGVAADAEGFRGMWF